MRLTALGDVARAAEAAWALAEAGHEVEWLVEEEFASLVRALPFIGNLFVLPRRRWTRRLKNPFSFPIVAKDMFSLILDLHDRRFDAACDIQGNFRSALLTFLSGARMRIGFSAASVYEAASFFYTRTVVLPSRRIHRVVRAFLLLRELGVSPPSSPPPVQIDKTFVKMVEEFLYQHRALDKPLIVIHPGVSGFGGYKRWSPERFGRLAEMLRKERGAFVAVTWAGDEYDLAIRCARASNDAAVVTPKLSDLRHLMALLARASLVIAVDTGPLHLAALLRRPTVALFGPKDEHIYRPWGPGEIVTSPVPCRPCRKRRCRHPICMNLIKVESVFDVCMRVLQNSTPFEEKHLLSR